MEIKTPLYDNHLKSNGKMVPFAGYLLPVQYKTGVIAEHMAVRNKAGLFDVSHMGEVIIKGKDALKNIEYLMTNDCSQLSIGAVRYSPMCNEEGGTVDDLLIYRIEEETYLLVVNASNRQKDVEWMKGHIFGEVELLDISDTVALIALQGPNSTLILEELTKKEYIPKQNYSFTKDVEIDNIKCLISKTGYTGEDGYEIFISPTDAPKLWDKLLEVGSDFGLIPAGLGARDTLRLEAGMPLYGHELSEEISPLEAGLSFAVKMNKEDFIGKRAMEQRVVSKKRVGLKVIGRGIVRENFILYSGEKQVGITTSGTHCPYLNHAYAVGLVENEFIEIGTELEAENRGRRIKVQVVSLPFYKRSNKI